MNDSLNQTLIRGHEGYRLTAYRDTRGFLTIGVGFNLDGAGASIVCALADVSFSAARSGMALRPDQVDAIFAEQYAVVAAQARKIFPAIDSFPDNAGAVICDMLFELGLNGFLAFHNTEACFQARDWAGAIAGIQNSELESEVPGRVKNNIVLLSALVPNRQAA
jgi:GH24 family phage-related lysozyme (muramidase)